MLRQTGHARMVSLSGERKKTYTVDIAISIVEMSEEPGEPCLTVTLSDPHSERSIEDLKSREGARGVQGDQPKPRQNKG